MVTLLEKRDHGLHAKKEMKGRALALPPRKKTIRTDHNLRPVRIAGSDRFEDHDLSRNAG
jgi:hypothetical protein